MKYKSFEAALEEITEEECETPKRVKYEKVKFTEAWRAVQKFEEGEKLYTKRSHKDFILIDDINDVLRFLYDLHVEKEITECDEFIDFIETKFNNDNRFINRVMAEALFDAGCRFKLIKGE